MTLVRTNLRIAGALCLLLAACGGARPQKDAPAEAAGGKDTLVFELPDVPVMLQTVEERLRFVTRHYWDKFDFRDTAYVHAPEVTEQALVNYLDLLARVSPDEADSCLTGMLARSVRTAAMGRYMAGTIRRYLFDPNSPFRDETLYEPAARFLSASREADEAVRSRARHDLKLIRLNRPGTVAADFVYTLSSGAQGRLHALDSPYVLLLFYNPDCHGCAETLEALKSSSFLNGPASARIRVLAFYPDEDRQVWLDHRADIPPAWINGYDKDLAVLSGELYDLKAMPTLYLLDKDKTVLLKDAAVGEIEEYFENKPL